MPSQSFQKSVSLLFTSFSILLCFGATQVIAGQWQAGFASTVITPSTPTWMAGYASRNRPADGKVNELYAKSMVLQDSDGTKFVLVTTDLISVPYPIRGYLQQHIKAQYGLPPESLMINCSHTHCGPEIRTTRWSLDGLPSERLKGAQQYLASLQSKLTDVISAAMKNLEPVQVSYCRSRCGFGMNRRTLRNGSYANFPNPDGPVDHDVPVLRISNNQDVVKGIVFGYACHNTTIGIYQFCGDYAGFAQEQLETSYPDAVAMFVLGAGADINPYPRGSVDLAKTHGKTLATAVEAALATNQNSLPAKLTLHYGKATLDYSDAPSEQQLTERSQSTNSYISLHAKRLLKQLKEQGSLRAHYDAPIQTIQFGDQLTLIALPGETCVDYALRLKAELGKPHLPGRVWVAGYSNDVFAYIPSRRVLLEGGYEAGDSMKYFTTVLQHGPFAQNIEERIVNKVHELLKTP